MYCKAARHMLVSKCKAYQMSVNRVTLYVFHKVLITACKEETVYATTSVILHVVLQLYIFVSQVSFIAKTVCHVVKKCAIITQPLFLTVIPNFKPTG